MSDSSTTEDENYLASRLWALGLSTQGGYGGRFHGGVVENGEVIHPGIRVEAAPVQPPMTLKGAAMNQQTTPMADAIEAAMFVCPYGTISVEECTLMVRAAIATYLHYHAEQIGTTAGLKFTDENDDG